MRRAGEVKQGIQAKALEGEEAEGQGGILELVDLKDL